MSWANPFGLPGIFRRGNLHTHSDRSDGHRTPEAICALYATAGYDFLCLSDHFLKEFGYPLTDGTPFERDGFVTIRGAELHAGRVESGEHWHLLGVGSWLRDLLLGGDRRASGIPAANGHRRCVRPDHNR